MNAGCYRWIRIVGVTASLLAPGASAFAQAPPPGSAPAAPTTAVMVSLTIKPEVDRAQLMKSMPAEVRDTVRAYLDGKIQQWFSLADGRGVLFILNCSTLAEAKAIMGELPLAKANLANFEYTALGPLTPLRMLLADPSAPVRNGPQ